MMISYDIFSNIAILSALPLNKLPFYLLKVKQLTVLIVQYFIYSTFSRLLQASRNSLEQILYFF